MTTNTAHTRTYIEQKRAEYEAASSPAGPSRLFLLPTHGEGLPGEELGRNAKNYEDMHKQHFSDELSGMFVAGVWALAALVFAAGLVAGRFILPYLSQLFFGAGL